MEYYYGVLLLLLLELNLLSREMTSSDQHDPWLAGRISLAEADSAGENRFS